MQNLFFKKVDKEKETIDEEAHVMRNISLVLGRRLREVDACPMLPTHFTVETCTDDTWIVTAGPQYAERRKETDCEVHDLVQLLPESLQSFHLDSVTAR